VTVTASSATGNALLVFKAKSSAGPNPPTYVLPCVVSR
jgi:hypothetical protein